MLGPPGGILYGHVKGPVAITGEKNDSGYNSHGESSAWTVLYLLSFGDASIDTAKQNGSKNPGQVRVTHVDYEWHHVLGIGKYTLRVYYFDPAVKEQH
jgi:hypothetical protein